MLYREISRILGRFLLCLSAIFLLPLSVSLFYEMKAPVFLPFETSSTLAFLKTLGLCLFLSLFFLHLGKTAKGVLYRKESILLVTFIWLFTAAIGSLPFVFTNKIPSYIDAYFETISGLTTTGATIIYPKMYDAKGVEIPITLKNPLDPSLLYTFYGTVPPLLDPLTGSVLEEGVEALGKPLLFWRSLLQWMGGMGIVVLFIAVLPALSLGGKFLFETEVTGPTKEGIVPRLHETATLLWKIYLTLTLFQTSLLLLTNPAIDLFDAINLSFSTISTGGFTVRNDGIASYASFSTQGILALFMVLGSLNFTLYFHLLKQKFSRLYDREFLFYLLLILGGCLLMTFSLWDTPQFSLDGKGHHFSFLEALGIGSFQAISAQTSTGFTLSNYDFWPFSCQFLMFLLMFIGGMSGSTTGGLKTVRFILIFKMIKNRIENLFRPEQVTVLKIGGREISEKSAGGVSLFFIVMVLLTMGGAYLLMLDHNDLQTSLGIISCMVNNTGLGFGGIGSYGSFAFLSPFSKMVSILWMVLGRLEYFAILVLFLPSFWRMR